MSDWPASDVLRAPFPYFGGKRTIADEVWRRFGKVKQYIEPFCGSAAILLANRFPASLEVLGDANGFIANFWRAVKHQPQRVAEWADYPVSHIDMGGRHEWLMAQRAELGAALLDPNWPGDAKVAGWWLWGQCCKIGGGWCEWEKQDAKLNEIPHVGNAGMGIQAIGAIPHVSDAGMGFLTSSGLTASHWLNKIAKRLERCRIIHGEWDRCLNNHYGSNSTAIFFDPPYRNFEGLYGVTVPVADQVADWCRENDGIRIALCGHKGDYELPGWEAFEWDRGRLTYSSSKTTDQECVWFSPACEKPSKNQRSLFDEEAVA